MATLQTKGNKPGSSEVEGHNGDLSTERRDPLTNGELGIPDTPQPLPFPLPCMIERRGSADVGEGYPLT